MALAFDKAGQNITTGSSSGVCSVSLAAASANSIAIIAVINGGGSLGSTDDFTSMQVGGVNATQIGTVQTNSSTRYIRFFYFLNPPTTATTYAVNSSAPFAGSSEAEIVVAIYSGAAQSGQPDSSTVASNSGSSVTASTTVVAPNCWLVSGAIGQGGTLTAGTGTTRRVTTADGLVIGDSAATVGTGSQSLVWSNSNGAKTTTIFIASIAPAVAATTSSRLALLGVG